MPQAPQLALSVCVFTQTAAMPAPQEVWPEGHWHAPATQVRPAPHALPQAPQLALSVCVSTQLPLIPMPQKSRPEGHAQEPAVQV